MRALDAIGHALAVAGSMTWEITWALILVARAALGKVL